MKRILNRAQRERLSCLREAESQRTLSSPEQAELAALFQIIEDAEAAYLKPAMTAMAQERQRLETQIAQMRSLMQRREALVRHLQQVLEYTRKEWEDIDAETNSLAITESISSHAGAIR